MYVKARREIAMMQQGGHYADKIQEIAILSKVSKEDCISAKAQNLDVIHVKLMFLAALKIHHKCSIYLIAMQDFVPLELTLLMNLPPSRENSTLEKAPSSKAKLCPSSMYSSPFAVCCLSKKAKRVKGSCMKKESVGASGTHLTS